MMTDDQGFLLTIIFGIYFGPHLRGERPPHKSAMQRVVERLPQYTTDQLTGCQMMVVQMMRAYYYILGKASKSVMLAPSVLLKFFHDTLPSKVLGPAKNYPRFTDFFPIDLHSCSFVGEQFVAIDNIVFINNPSTSYLREEVLARFRSLTGLQEFILEMDTAKLPNHITDEAFYEVVAPEARSGEQSHFSGPPRSSHGKKRMSNEALHVMPLRMAPYEDSPTPMSSFSSRKRDTYFKAQHDAKLVFSPLSTTEMQCYGAAAAWIAGVGAVGNVDVGLTGSITGRVSLAESEDCYLFQVSLPGVRRDQTFSYELDMSGKVLIEGETAMGGQVVESKRGNLCPSGHFSLRFQLPGRVDPRLPQCNFGSDGTFEGVVKKLTNNDDFLTAQTLLNKCWNFTKTRLDPNRVPCLSSSDFANELFEFTETRLHKIVSYVSLPVLFFRCRYNADKKRNIIAPDCFFLNFYMNDI
ncbi:hypothetical protein BT93_H1239 [Corymbia citriodora subsp. variegata]|nr:hypothetical protein BT93_H1239 [Corymbia citriodora subsp. variegata]